MSKPEDKSIQTGQEDYKAMESADERQIVAEIKGFYSPGMVYKFKSGGRDVTGISWTGIKEIAYQLARTSGRAIDTEIVSRVEDADKIMYTIRATHRGIGSRLGVATQLKKFDNGKIDQFAEVKALSKAQRNAMRTVLPEESIKAFIDTFQNKSGSVVDPRKMAEADAEYSTRDDQPAEPETPRNMVGHRWQDEKGYWQGEDIGLVEIPTVGPLPADYVAALVEAKIDPKLFVVRSYAGDPVIGTTQWLIGATWTQANAVFMKLGFLSCKAGKSTHWFPDPKNAPSKQPHVEDEKKMTPQPPPS